MLQASGQVSVLVVEDDQPVAQLLRDVCEGLGWKVVEAHDGEAGFGAARVHHPDLVLLDLMMAPVDGLELLSRMREAPDLRDTPVLVVTAISDPSLEQRAVALGAADILRKPFRVYELQARARLVLEEARFRRAEVGRTAAPGASRATLVEPEAAVAAGVAECLELARARGQRLLCIVMRLESLRQAIADGDPAAKSARDEMLKRARRVMRASDRLFASGEDSALLLLPGADHKSAAPLLQRLGDQADAIPVGDSGRKVELRFGFALYPHEAVTTGEELVRLARATLP